MHATTNDVPASVRDLTLDLTSLAQNVAVAATLLDMECDDATKQTASAVVETWEALTGLTGQAALAAADAIQRHPVPVTAVVVPF